MQLSDKRKAFAGALSGFLLTFAQKLAGEATVQEVVTSGMGLLELGLGLVAGYAIVYWFPANAEKKP